MMHWRKFPLAFLILTSSLLSAQATYRLSTRSVAEHNAAQRRVVGQYCRLDYEGSRFSDAGWQKMRPLLPNRENPDIPYIDIVTRYQIEPPATQFRSPEVNVTYQVIGRFDNNYGYVAANSMRTVTFRVEERNGELLITDMEPNTPRVSKRAAAEWLKSRLSSTQDPVLKSTIERALAALEPPTTPAGVPGAKPAEPAKPE